MKSDPKRVYLPVVSFIALCFVAYLVAQSKPSASGGKKTPSPILNVSVIELEPQDLSIMLDSFGTLSPKTQTDLFPSVSGRVISVSPHFQAGGFFTKDDVLLQIEPDDYRVEVEVAKGNVAKAELALAEEQARHEQAKRDWKKQKKDELATDLALRLPQLKAAHAELNTAEARLELAELNVQRTQVKAPYDGRVLSTFVDLGSVVNPSSMIASLYSSDTVQVRLPIANKDLAYIKLPNEADSTSMKVSIENPLSQSGDIWESLKVRTEAAVDTQSQQLFLVADIASPFTPEHNKHPLKIGQYVKAQIQGNVVADAIVVPNSAIYQGTYVYTVEAELLQRSSVKVAWRNDSISLIAEGLKAGDLLVTTALGQVISGTKVEIISESSGVHSDSPGESL